MAETKIEWTQGPNGEKGFSFNGWIGCKAISPACDFCYAKEWATRYGRDFNTPTRTSESNWRQPLRWNAEAARLGTRYRVFCSSLADVFDNQVPDSWRIDLLDLIHRTPNLDWLLLTKRIGNAHHMLNVAARNLVGGAPTWWNADAWPNVWIGATVVNQEEADRDIPKLQKVPAAKRFLSMEPLLGPVNLESAWRHWNDSACEWGEMPDVMIDWVIVGGESGHHARPMHPNWVRSLRDQCQKARVPFFFKQWGNWAPARKCIEIMASTLDHKFDDGTWMERAVSKKEAGNFLDGRIWNQVPQSAA